MIDKAYVTKRLERMSELETQLSDPETAANQKKFRRLIQEHAALKKLSDRANRFFTIQTQIEENRQLLAGSDEDLKELATEELTDLESKIEKAEQDLMIALLPPDPTNERNAIVEIRAGTGGNEAALFAGDLFRMYNRLAESKGWKTGLIDAHASDVGGYKEVVFSIEGQGVYGELQYESGGHRVQRIPVTESQGRIHTSAATVAVFPEVEADDDIAIDQNDLRVDIFCSSGPGGQSVNTTYSAVRVTHIPTGLVAQSQDERSQHRNKEKAMSVLKARILDFKRREEEEKMGKTRRSMIGSGDRSERIRTYNFPQNRMTDHRINLTLYSLDRLVEGDLAELLNALQEHDVKLRLEQELNTPADQ